MNPEPLSTHHQVVLTREGRMDEMEVVVANLPGGRYRGEPIAVDRTACRARIKDSIGVTAKVSVVDANSIERPLGKAKRIVDKRPKG